MQGKYADALLISALTGARPSELATGIDVWVEFDELLRKNILCLHVIGVKVKASQGQPNRFVAYAEDDDHPGQQGSHSAIAGAECRGAFDATRPEPA